MILGYWEQFPVADYLRVDEVWCWADKPKIGRSPSRYCVQEDLALAAVRDGYS
jgi:hypothetical protein